jgi:RNA polymerase sigma-70 factor (ECF subfamily)
VGDDEHHVSPGASFSVDQTDALLALYDSALPEIYGYLARRSPSVAVAEDLTSETFLAAVDTVQRRPVDAVTVAWLIGIARHKLADHWRRDERDQRRLTAVAGELDDHEDPWDETIDATVAHATLDALGPHHRAALTFRYLDGLPVRQVADLMDRTEHATEALLVRARRAFRDAYGERSDPETGHDTEAGDV